MSEKRLMEVTSKGGKNSQKSGKGHRWTKEDALRASQKAIEGRARAKIRRMLDGEDE